MSEFEINIIHQVRDSKTYKALLLKLSDIAPHSVELDEEDSNQTSYHRQSDPQDTG